MLRIAAALAILVSTLALPGCAVSRGDDDPSLGELLDQVVAAGAPGAFVVLREDGHVQREARGFADSQPPTRMRGDERFRIGSITKTFVAALVLRLVQDGRLTLDDSVERWLPGLLPEGRSITVRELLSHTSGLFDYVEDERVLRSTGRRWTPEELVAVATAHSRERPPSGTFAYSSTNYIVLGLIAERAGGAPLERQLRTRLFRPLGLRDTSFVPGTIRGPHVHGHRPPSHQGIVTGAPADTSAEPAWWTGAAGAIVSTADDVERFFAALLHGRVVGPRLLREMETMVPAGANRYGLGIAAFPTPCGAAWGHTGNVQGTIAVAWNTKDASRQVVLVVNTYPLSAELEDAVRRLQLAAFCSELAAAPRLLCGRGSSRRAHLDRAREVPRARASGHRRARGGRDSRRPALLARRRGRTALQQQAERPDGDDPSDLGRGRRASSRSSSRTAPASRAWSSSGSRCPRSSTDARTRLAAWSGRGRTRSPRTSADR